MHKKVEVERERAEKQVQEELKELTRRNNRYNIKVPWKDEVLDVRDLSKDFGSDNIEWEEAFDAGWDPLKCHNVLKSFHGLFDWCEDDYWKQVYISRSWNSACYVSETRRGLENIGAIYQYDHKAYKPITDKWEELLPSDKREPMKKESTDEDRLSEDATGLV